MRKVGLLLAFLAAFGVCARDIDVESYVRKYWTFYLNRKVGNGDKRWPNTPELKAEKMLLGEGDNDRKRIRELATAAALYFALKAIGD